jgi:hypothetical protein
MGSAGGGVHGDRRHQGGHVDGRPADDDDAAGDHLGVHRRDGSGLPDGVSFGQALSLAGEVGKLRGVKTQA